MTVSVGRLCYNCLFFQRDGNCFGCVSSGGFEGAALSAPPHHQEEEEKPEPQGGGGVGVSPRGEKRFCLVVPKSTKRRLGFFLPCKSQGVILFKHGKFCSGLAKLETIKWMFDPFILREMEVSGKLRPLPQRRKMGALVSRCLLPGQSCLSIYI